MTDAAEFSYQADLRALATYRLPVPPGFQLGSKLRAVRGDNCTRNGTAYEWYAKNPDDTEWLWYDGGLRQWKFTMMGPD